MRWIHVKEKKPPYNVKVKVLVPDLTPFMMNLERIYPMGEYESVFKPKPRFKCCTDPRHTEYHEKLKWSNNEGYYATHWMHLPSPPKEENES